MGSFSNPIKVPVASNTVIRKNANVVLRLALLANPEKSSLNKVGLIDGGVANTPCQFVTPNIKLIKLERKLEELYDLAGTTSLESIEITRKLKRVLNMVRQELTELFNDFNKEN